MLLSVLQTEFMDGDVREDGAEEVDFSSSSEEHESELLTKWGGDAGVDI